CRRGAAIAIAALLGLGLAQFSTNTVRADSGASLEVSAPGSNAVTLSIDELRALGHSKLTTTTPWTKGKQEFEGVTGAAFVAALAAKGIKLDAKSVIAVANNDYNIVIPVDVFNQPTTLIAFAQNGAAMPVRDKGPFWIVFPYDSDAKYTSSSYQTYSIWG